MCTFFIFTEMTVSVEAAFHMVIPEHLKFVLAGPDTPVSEFTCNYFKISCKYNSTDKILQTVFKSVIIKDEHYLIKYLYKLLTDYLEIHCTMDISEHFFTSILEICPLKELQRAFRDISVQLDILEIDVSI